MIIDIRTLDRSAGHLSGEVKTPFDDPMAGERSFTCHVDVDYRQANGQVHCHGSVSGEVSTQCHRCLEPVTEQIAGEFDLVVRRGEHAGEQSDEIVTLGPHEYEVALDPIVHETVVVNLPMVVLCREDCRGLCPTCGANLNRTTCSCQAPPDPRWDRLRNLNIE